jgi:hypothetical protein
MSGTILFAEITHGEEFCKSLNWWLTGTQLSQESSISNAKRWLFLAQERSAGALLSANACENGLK